MHSSHRYGIAILLASVVSPAGAYIHFPPPTMTKMCQISSNIRVLTVKKFSKEKGVVIYDVVDTLKSKNPIKGMSFKHSIPTDTKGAKPIFDWLADGKRAVMFTIENGAFGCGYVFIDNFCYSVDYNRKGEYWLLIRVDPEMSACFHGSVETLQQVTKDLLGGKDVKVPVHESIKTMTSKEREKRAPALNEILIKNRSN